MKLWYSEAFITKNRACFKCPNCRNNSEVILSTEIFQILGFVEAISLIVFAFVVFKGGGSCLIGVGIITFIFAIFYSISPLFVYLKPSMSNEHNEKTSGNNNLKQTEKIESSIDKNKNTENEIFSN